MTTTITGLPSAATPLSGAERVPLDQTVGAAITASALSVGTGYRIESVGSTNWTACGLAAGVTASVGLTFVATAAGTGTGTAIAIETRDVAAADIAALAPATDLSYNAATRVLSSSTGADVTLPLAGVDAGLMAAGDKARIDQLGADDSPSFAGLTITGTAAVTIPHIHGDLAGAVYVHVKNTTASTLAKGAPVYPTGTVGDTTTLEVAGADSGNANALPAVGLLADALPPNASGHAVIAGELTGLNTAAYAIGEALYVGSGGGLTATRPTTGTIQQVAIVGRVHASTGSVTVTISTEISPNWDTAYSERLRWDGGATGLNAVTGRASLGLGTAAAADTGTAAGNVVVLDGSARLPAVDGSLLTGLPASFNPASPGAIGGTTPAAGTFTALVATTRLGLPTGAPASPVARDLYQVADTLRYRDSGGVERLLLNGADNLANLANLVTARNNLGLGSAATAASSDFVSATTTRAANLVLAGPTSGAAASPTFRALVAADLPAAPAEIGLACSDETTALTTGTAKITIRMPYAMTLTSVRLSVTTAPTGSALIVDVNEGGTSIFSTNPRIDAGSTTSVGSGTPAVISDTALADNAVITVDIDQIGSTVAGTGLKVWLIGRRA